MTTARALELLDVWDHQPTHYTIAGEDGSVRVPYPGYMKALMRVVNAADRECGSNQP